MKTGYKVGDCMTIHPITVSKDIKLFEAAKLMNEKHVGSLIVVEKGRLIGLLTEQDLVRKGMAELKDPAETKIQDIMIKEIMTITPGEDIYDALKTMRDYNIRQLPVVERGNLVGFLTLKDILKIQPQLFDLIVEKFELREERRKPVFGYYEDGVCEECNQFSQELSEVDGRMLCANCKKDEEE
jgi:CBS domain-containing protein